VNCTVRKRLIARAARVGVTRIAVEMAMIEYRNAGKEGRYPNIELKNGESMLVILRQQVCREQRERYL
jgi:hypothetical protein